MATDRETTLRDLRNVAHDLAGLIEKGWPVDGSVTQTHTYRHLKAVCADAERDAGVADAGP